MGCNGEGVTWQPRYVFEQLVQYIERGEVKPQVARVYPLSEICTAQQDFVGKTMPGKLVLTVPRR